MVVAPPAPVNITLTDRLPGPEHNIIFAPGGGGLLTAILRKRLAEAVGFDPKELMSEGVHWHAENGRLVVMPAISAPEDYEKVLIRSLLSETAPGGRIYIASGVLADFDVDPQREGLMLSEVLSGVFNGTQTPELRPAQIDVATISGFDRTADTSAHKATSSATPEATEHAAQTFKMMGETIESPEQAGDGSDPDPTPDPRRATGTTFNDDHPVTSINGDLLNRRAIAEAVADNVRHAWVTPAPRPFIVHLSGRWGSGKSTVLNFVAEFLRKPVYERLEDRPNRDPKKLINREAWVIVQFNAWQQQNDGNAWWSLLNAMAAQAPGQLGAVSGATFKLWDWWWRITGQFLTLLVGLVLAVLATVYFWAYMPDINPNALPPGATETITETRTGDLPAAEGLLPGTRTETRTDLREGRPPPSLLDQVGGLKETLTLLLALLTGLGALLVRNKKSEAALTELQLDPTEPLRTRYAQMVTRIDHPVAVFIDDLDRCDAAYVVELLQAAQNIYGDVPVLYIVASDKDWLVSSYEQSYAAFAEHVSRPGKPLGHLFVEKIFQLSVNVPELSDTDRDSFLGTLTGPRGATPLKGIEDFPELASIRDSLDAADGNIEAIRAITRANKDNPKAEAIKSEAFRQTLSASAEASVQHYLQDFDHLMEANPRAIKRVVNAFQFLQGYAILAGADLRMEALALWSILDLRYPYATRRLRQDPLRWTQEDVDTYAPTPLARRILDALTDEEIETLRRFG